MKKKLIRITTVPYSFWSLLNGQLKFMQDYYEVTAISAPLGTDLKNWAEKEEIPYLEVSLTRQITPLKDLRALWQLYRYFRKEKPYIVHTHTPKAGTVGMLAAWLARVPHRLHTIAGLPLMETTGMKRWILDRVEKITYRCATRIYPNSKGLYDFIASEGYCTTDKMKIIGKGSSNGVDTIRFDPAQMNTNSLQKLKSNLGFDSTDFIFLFIGRLVRDKGINELISVYQELAARHTDMKLLLVGVFEPELDPLNSETVRTIENHPGIVTTGDIADVRPYIALADLVVFPSYREGFPNVVLESGAMGKAVIATDINGCNEIIIDGRNGLIVPPKNPEALKDAMYKLYANNSLREKLAAEARPNILEKYQRPVVWKSLLNEYQGLDSGYEAYDLDTHGITK